MFEEQKQLLNKIKENNSLILQKQKENENFQKELISFATTLIGKCYSQPNLLRGYKLFFALQNVWKLNDGLTSLRCDKVDKLNKVFQIIGIKNSSFVIQEAEEVIREVSPKDRLTWENHIYECDIQRFIFMNHINLSEISLDEYLNTIKLMQKRDSYCCWKTSIKIHD